MPYRYILDGSLPVPEPDLLLWAHWYETTDRTIATSDLGAGGMVHTIFLGVDHNCSGQGGPLLFESRVCGGPLRDHLAY